MSLGRSVPLSPRKAVLPDGLVHGWAEPQRPVLVVLAAGLGKRFGGELPKCVQRVRGKPAALHTIDAAAALGWVPAVVVVGHRADAVRAALGPRHVYVLSDNPKGGTAFAAWEALGVPGLLEADPLLLITMGDKVMTPDVLLSVCQEHLGGPREGDLTFLTAVYDGGREKGKGRIVRDGSRAVVKIMEQADIDRLLASGTTDPESGRDGRALDALREANCPLYAARASAFLARLGRLENRNAQGEYYLTDAIAAVRRAGGAIRTVTVDSGSPDHDLLTADITRPEDIARLDRILAAREAAAASDAPSEAAAAAAARLLEGRPIVQAGAIAAQLFELYGQAIETGFDPAAPAAVAVVGGRERLACMHPDMGRFHGPALQRPIGAGDRSGREQVVLLLQPSGDGGITLATAPEFRDGSGRLPAGCVWSPGPEVASPYEYEAFGTRMAESILRALGYSEDAASRYLRRPFPLVANAIASMRTVRDGDAGARIRAALGPGAFTGLRAAIAGKIPRGGFSSSSAVVLAVQNALNAHFGLGLRHRDIESLACQAEYGTGVRAGSLDHVTEQSGRSGQSTLISSDPADGYAVLGTFEVPPQSIRTFFANSVPRDIEAWRWSAGLYAERSEPGGRLTTVEMRKMTGKSAEIAALLVRLPLGTSFFGEIRADLLDDGELEAANLLLVYRRLRAVPLRVPVDALRALAAGALEWLAGQIAEREGIGPAAARARADHAGAALFDGWREPLLPRRGPEGSVAEERGVPVRAMLAYLYGEVAKNLWMIHHPASWIEMVRRSQLGDRAIEIDPRRLPDPEDLVRTLPWEAGRTGPVLLDEWLARAGARPHDFDRGLDDAALDRRLASLAAAAASGLRPDPDLGLHRLDGGSFFRGLALIDLIEAMLLRAFGADAVAVRVNGAGQGDFYQVHVDGSRPGVSVPAVQEFLRRAVARRFGIEAEFVTTHPGGGAVAVRLGRLDLVSRLAGELAEAAGIRG